MSYADKIGVPYAIFLGEDEIAEGKCSVKDMRSGEQVALTPMEYGILKLLMEHPGKVFSTKVIYETVWQETALGNESSVAVHIRHLREKLEITPSEPRYLKVVWGQGYKMEDKP